MTPFFNRSCNICQRAAFQMDLAPHFKPMQIYWGSLEAAYPCSLVCTFSSHFWTTWLHWSLICSISSGSTGINLGRLSIGRACTHSKPHYSIMSPFHPTSPFSLLGGLSMEVHVLGLPRIVALHPDLTGRDLSEFNSRAPCFATYLKGPVRVSWHGQQAPWCGECAWNLKRHCSADLSQFKVWPSTPSASSAFIQEKCLELFLSGLSKNLSFLCRPPLLIPDPVPGNNAWNMGPPISQVRPRAQTAPMFRPPTLVIPSRTAFISRPTWGV